jgi:hypothetical protein
MVAQVNGNGVYCLSTVFRKRVQAATTAATQAPSP